MKCRQFLFQFTYNSDNKYFDKEIFTTGGRKGAFPRVDCSFFITLHQKTLVKKFTLLFGKLVMSRKSKNIFWLDKKYFDTYTYCSFFIILQQKTLVEKFTLLFGKLVMSRKLKKKYFGQTKNILILICVCRTKSF